MSATIHTFPSHFENAFKKRRLFWVSLIWVFTGFVALSTAVILAFHVYVAWTLSHPTVARLVSNPLAAVGLPYENMSFPSRDGLSTLSGWYIPAEGSADTIVFSHGYGENREQSWVHVYDLARTLHRDHYNVLLFDYSFVNEGTAVTGGIRERQELLGAIDYAMTKTDGRVFVWGFSMGAGTALQAALIDPEMDGMILDSTFLLDPDTLYLNLRQAINLPRFPSLPLIRFFFPLVGSVPLRDIPFHQVESASYQVPLFFIHSKEDAKAPFSLITSLYKRQKTAQSELWLVPDAKHELIYRQHKQEYVSRALGFLHSLDQTGAPNL